MKIGFGGPGISLIIVGYVGCNAPAAIAFFVIGFGLNGAVISGYVVNNIEIAPNFAGKLNP